jgi:phage terminase large subunit GpA-like protein
MTPQVIGYCKARQSRGVYPIKGQGGDKLPLTRPSKGSREKGLFIVGVDGIKSDIMSWLKVDDPGDGYCHFPKDSDDIPVNGYDAVYFEMLTSEKKVRVQKKTGKGVYEWHKAAGARNESFDCRVYARAALRIMSPTDEVMLRRIYRSEPWAAVSMSGTRTERNGEPIPQDIKPKKKRDRNERGREAGIYL